MIRPAVVAGRFYAGDPQSLRQQIRECLPPPREKQRALGIVVPHAGYLYSGRVAAAVYSVIQLPKRLVLLCPNHTGRGAPFAIQTSGQWKTPLGLAGIDEELGAAIKRSSPLFEEDWRAHESEHALEVHLPFLQYFCEDFLFVPICIGDHHLQPLLEIASALANSLRGCDEPVLLIASSDMTHYESDAEARRKDQQAIEPMLRVDAEGLYRTVQSQAISMCGFAPATIVLSAARQLGATRGELVKYATSGEVSGDFHQVVGYAGILVH